MSRRPADLNDLLSDLDEAESFSDDPYGVPALDDEDIAILHQRQPDGPVFRRRAPPPAKPKRGRPKKKT